MPFLVSDVISRSPARATLSDLAEQVKAGAERLDDYHQLEREHIHQRLIDDAGKGLDDVAAGRVTDARTSLQSIKRRRAASSAD